MSLYLKPSRHCIDTQHDLFMIKPKIDKPPMYFSVHCGVLENQKRKHYLKTTLKSDIFIDQNP